MFGLSTCILTTIAVLMCAEVYGAVSPSQDISTTRSSPGAPEYVVLASDEDTTQISITMPSSETTQTQAISTDDAGGIFVPANSIDIHFKFRNDIVHDDKEEREQIRIYLRSLGWNEEYYELANNDPGQHVHVVKLGHSSTTTMASMKKPSQREHLPEGVNLINEVDKMAGQKWLLVAIGALIYVARQVI